MTSSVLPEFYERTCLCGEFKASHQGQTVTALGWVKKIRNHGAVVFVDLRDKTGFVQVVCDPSVPALKSVLQFSLESVVAVKGQLKLRPQKQISQSSPTGQVEIQASHCEILSPAGPTPFVIDSKNVSEALSLKYRYLSLRSSKLQKNLNQAHSVYQLLRKELEAESFKEVVTPCLYKATPEGARDYLVPSRHIPGSFYALPQSPQILKQLLMIAGMDRYFQIAKCFRDEDMRSDRQPEFVQLDMEMSFVSPKTIQALNQKLITSLWKTFKNQNITHINSLTYQEAMDTYGTDRPDLRNPLKLHDVTSLAKNSSFELFEKTLKQGGNIKGLCAGLQTNFSGSRLKKITEEVKHLGLKTLLWMKSSEGGGLTSPMEKHLSPHQMENLFRAGGGKENSIVFLLPGLKEELYRPAHFLIQTLGRDLISKDKDCFVWIKDFPLLEYDHKAGRWKAFHHPFTAPHPEDLPLLKEQKLSPTLRALAYDLVCNGQELGGGSMRIHHPAVQKALFKALGFSEKEYEDQFGFFIKALSFGTPPHGGMAWGMERLLMLLCNTQDIKDVVAFPKTSRGMCLMSQAPSPVSPAQLADLGIQIMGKQSLK